MIVLARGLAVVVWIAFITYNSILVVQFLGGTPTDAGLLVAIGSITFASRSNWKFRSLRRSTLSSNSEHSDSIWKLRR